MSASVRFILPSGLSSPTFKLSTRAAPDTLLSTVYTATAISGRPTVYAFTTSVADGDYAITQLQYPYAVGVVQIAGTTAEVYGSFEELDAATSGGSATVTVLPASVTLQSRFVGQVLELALGETGTVTKTFYNADRTPLDMSGRTLAVVWETRTGDAIASVESGDITISGEDDNTLSFDIPADVTDVVRVCDDAIIWAVRDRGNGNMDLVDGPCTVKMAAGAVP